MTARQDDKTIVSYEEVPCRIADAIALFDAKPSTRGWTVLHTDSGRARTIVGVAERPVFTASGATRFDRAKAFLSGVSSRFPKNVELPMAFCFAGFSQQPFNHESAWATWPNLAIFIPDVVVVDDGASVRAFKRSDLQTEFVRSQCDQLGHATPCAAQVADANTGPQTSSERVLATSSCEFDGLLVDRDEARGTWIKLVESALLEIRNDSVSKLVPARERVGSLGAGRQWALSAILARLCSAKTSSTVYCVQSPDGRAFLGASPELLVRKRGTDIESMALAGTAERVKNSEDHAALQDEKNQREHRVVREEIVASLERAGAHASAESVPEATAFGSIQHLKTVIHAVGSSDTNLFDLVSNLHPTPAVSGAPSDASQRWLAEHEAMERGYYAGPFGFVDTSGDGEFHVALRCALLDQSHAHIYAGAGVVAGSEPNAEWDETGWKLSTMAEALVAEDIDR